jgi:hypothetical protein
MGDSSLQGHSGTGITGSGSSRVGGERAGVELLGLRDAGTPWEGPPPRWCEPQAVGGESAADGETASPSAAAGCGGGSRPVAARRRSSTGVAAMGLVGGCDQSGVAGSGGGDVGKGGGQLQEDGLMFRCRFRPHEIWSKDRTLDASKHERMDTENLSDSRIIN